MEERDRRTIMSNLQALVEQTHLDVLGPLAVTKKIFRQDDIDGFQSQPSTRERNREFYLAVQKRGPVAFRSLVHILAESGHFDLAKLLNPVFDVERHFLELKVDEESGPAQIVLGPHTGGTVPNGIPAYENEHLNSVDAIPVNVKRKPITVKVKKATRYFGEPEYRAYKMTSNPKGYCFIVNNVEFINGCHELREGAEVDGKNMIDLWHGLGYKVEYKENCGQMDFRNALVAFAEKVEHADVDSCAVVIMSHGSTAGITMCDSKTIEYEWIFRQFNNLYCPRLQGKPKMFFFQACRGDTVDYGATRRSSTSTDGKPVLGEMVSPRTPDSSKLTTFSDMYLARSSYPGYASIRDHDTGSWFVEAICTVFMEMAHNTNLEDMMKLVGVKVAALEDDLGRKQTVVTESHLFTKNLYFNPGLFANPSLTYPSS